MDLILKHARLSDPAAKRRLVRETLDGDDIVIDFLYYNLVFCEDRGFDADKTLLYFTIVQRLFDFTFGGGPPKSIDESFQFFKSLVLDNDLSDVDLIADFVTSTFYRHFTAYTYCFSNVQPVQLDERRIVVETPLTPLPLCQATPEELLPC